MDRQRPTSSSFDLSTLLVELPYTESDANSAQRCLTKPTGITDEQLTSDLMTSCVIDHEFSHYRCLISTSVGYLLFFLKQIVVLAKLKLIQNYPKSHGAIALYIKDINALSGNHPDAAAALSDLMYFGQLLKFMDKYDPQIADVIVEDIPATLIHSEDHLVDAHRIPFPLLNSVTVGNNLLAVDPSSLPTLYELLEGWALWKEYALLSRVLWHGYRDRFHLTNEWLGASTGQRRYRYVPDLILEATGANLSMALPGVLIDIALNAPIFSDRPRTWQEAHPSLRLVEMLRTADQLPRRLRMVDNIDLVGEEFYREVETFFARALGWTSVESNLHDTCDAVDRRVAWARQISRGESLTDVLGRFYDSRFRLGLSARGELLSTMLFPWNNPRSNSIGRLTIPPAVWYRDAVSVSTLQSETWVQSYLHLLDVTLTLFLEACLNFEPWGPPTFASARGIYKAIPTTFSQEQLSSINFKNSFEEFIGSCIGRDYGEFQQSLRP